MFLSLKIDFVLANSADPDEMQHSAAFHLDLHCFCKITHLGVSILQRVNEFCSISSGSSLFGKITHLGISILQSVNELLSISTSSFILFAYDKVIYIEDFIYSIAKEKQIFQTFILSLKLY